MLWLPPVPVVVAKIVVQLLASAETWSWKARPKAVSQFSPIRQRSCELPRSTWIDWGSPNALDHRVPALPSTALAAGKLAFSVDEAVAGRFSATLVVPQSAGAVWVAVITGTATEASTVAARGTRRRSLMSVPVGGGAGEGDPARRVTLPGGASESGPEPNPEVPA